jgi:hypothetical protein
LAQLVEYGEPEYAPKMEERKMHCTITPKKIIKKKKDAAAAALTQDNKEDSADNIDSED